MNRDYLMYGLLGFIAYVLWEQYQFEMQQAAPAPMPNYVSPTTVCN